MATKDELLQSVLDNITLKTANNSITPEILGQVITDAINYTAPDLSGDTGTEIYTLSGKSVYEKVIFEPDGNNLSQIDLSIPEGHSLLNISSVRENTKGVGIEYYLDNGPIVISNSVELIFSGATSGFTVNDVIVEDCDISFEFDTPTGDTTVNLSYVAGQDLIIPTPQIQGRTWLDKITISNSNISVGNFEAFEVKFNLSIDGVNTGTTTNGQNQGLEGWNGLVFYDDIHTRGGSEALPSGAPTGTLNDWTLDGGVPETISFGMDTNALYLENDYVNGELDFRLTYEDATTEDISFSYSGDTIEIELSKDPSDFSGSTTIVHIQVLNTSTFDLNGPILLDELFIGKDYDNLDLTEDPGNWNGDYLWEGTTFVKSQTVNFVTNIVDNTLSNISTAQNIFITLRYIDLT